MSESKPHPFLLQALVSVASACAVVSAYTYLTRAPDPSPARSPASMYMDRRIAHIDLRQVSLQDALKQTADAAGVEIKLDPTSDLLQRATEMNVSIEMALVDVPLQTVLESVAWQSSLDMEWRFEPDHVLVTDRSRFIATMPNVPRLYEVDDLLARGERFAALFPPPAMSYYPRWGTLPERYSPRATALESLASLAMFVGDDPWSWSGKPPGEPVYGLNRLLVRAPVEGHARIRAALEQIRRGGGAE